MRYIENLSLSNIIKGFHKNRANESVLIQIITPGDQFPKPKDTFLEVHRFEIPDLIDRDTFDRESRFTIEHASHIVKILIDSYNFQRHVVVHCAAGVSRSGAVARIGNILGFEMRHKNQIPNPNMMRLMETAIIENESYSQHLQQILQKRYGRS